MFISCWDLSVQTHCTSLKRLPDSNGVIKSEKSGNGLYWKYARVLACAMSYFIGASEFAVWL